MKKLLMVTPHLSTGGLPQFLLKKIEELISEFDIYCIEWDNFTGGQLIVQRKRIETLLGDKLITIGESKEFFLTHIDKIKPDIIHFEEFPETFIDHSILDKVFSNRNYLIAETTHGTLFNKEDKKYIADKTLFVSNTNYTQFYSITNDATVVEFKISDRDTRVNALIDLGLDPTYFHVMNVGLFNSNKNQGEIFEYARALHDKKIKFHFFGNTAGNFESYWGPLLRDTPPNCTVWGERDDLHKFYSCMDLFLFTSKLENRPISVLEALANNMPVLMYNLPSYGGSFSQYDNIQFLSPERAKNIELLDKLSGGVKEKKTILETVHKPLVESISTLVNGRKVSAYHMLTDIDTQREIDSMKSLSKLKKLGINYNICVNKRYTQLPPAETCEYPEKISMEPGGKLTPGHYGCYLAHKDAFFKGLESDSDFILIFECDCVIDVSYEEFMEKLEFACSILDKTDLLMFSFGYHNNTNIVARHEDYWEVDRFYGAHAYLIPRRSFENIKRMYDTCKWNVTDLLFAEKLNHYRTGIFETPITKQAAGYSILDKVYNEERH